MTLYSHDDKLLIDHLRKVALKCEQQIRSLKLFQNDRIRRDLLSKISFLGGAFHDLGKATCFFQHYLKTDNHEIIGPKSHALISALFVKEVTRRFLDTTLLNEFEKGLFSHFIFTVVKRHHGGLDNFKNELFIQSKVRELTEQVNAFEEQQTEDIISELAEHLHLNYHFRDFRDYITSESYVKDLSDFSMDLTESDAFEALTLANKIEYHYIHQLLYGNLLLSDKADVILGKEIPPFIVTNKLLEIFRKKKGFDSPVRAIDILKNEAFAHAIDNLPQVFSPEHHIYSLTLPTGLGKTITSFAVATEIKRLLGDPFRRIVISIPFTSIIDQNFDVYSQILDTSDTNIILKHHHLAEPGYKLKEDGIEENLNAEKSKFLIETWQSAVVITTFVQLLDSIFSSNKSMLMKLPNLANSIVILDEVQTIPYKYWELINKTFHALGKVLDCYFILMSATQPLLFLPGQEIKETIPDYEKYFSYFNRTCLINKTNQIVSLDEFLAIVHQYILANPSKDILVILNTKKHSKLFFEQLRDFIDSDTEDIYYLSTMITPFERKKIIHLIKTKSARRKIIISTQLVEAGVDISVDTVFRSMAPLDAIIQAAGRANRYQEKECQGEVYLYEIEDLRKATSLIYGVDLIQKTRNVLSKTDVVEENDYLSLIRNYFLEVRKQSDDHLSEHLEQISEFRFKDIGTFSLIEESESESIFLQLNTEAESLWNEYLAIYDNTCLNSFQQKELFNKIKGKFYDYVINVPIARNKSTIDFDNEKTHGFYVSYLNDPTVFYDYDGLDFSCNTGYKEINTLSF